MVTDVVMLVEIPNLEVILGVIVAFLVGVGGVYVYYVINAHFKSKNKTSNDAPSELLKYYERQLIDMKIRLDSLGVQDVKSSVQEQVSVRPHTNWGEGGAKTTPNAQITPAAKPHQLTNTTSPEITTAPEITNKHLNSTDYVLHLITNNPMTSRDIQTMLKKSREHTSRLMKRLYDEGYVVRNMESKPYTYSITEKGVVRIKT